MVLVVGSSWAQLGAILEPKWAPNEGQAPGYNFLCFVACGDREKKPKLKTTWGQLEPSGAQLGAILGPKWAPTEGQASSYNCVCFITWGGQGKKPKLGVTWGQLGPSLA